MQELQQQIDDLRQRLETIERQQRRDDVRLGPGPETPEAVSARVQRIADALKPKPHEHETDSEGRTICTTSGEAPSKVRDEQTEPTGQHKSYIVLCEEERQKGFVRPYRDSYKHAGPMVEGRRGGGCGTVTTMGRALSETYARDPKFYGATFCVGCNRHLPVSEFVWTADGAEVGS